jgi:hypothetical protein
MKNGGIMEKTEKMKQYCRYCGNCVDYGDGYLCLDDKGGLVKTMKFATIVKENKCERFSFCETAVDDLGLKYKPKTKTGEQIEFKEIGERK